MTPEEQLPEIFHCRLCGHCCHGETTVSLDQLDRERMADFFGLSHEEMAARYWCVNNGITQMKVVDGHCMFYAEKRCIIHPVRPWRCRQWPLHPSILLDTANLSAIRDSCPGINRTLGYEEFCRALRRIMAPDSARSKTPHEA